MNLHDELTQVAERAPSVVVPDDLWQRGRRIRRRRRVLVTGGSVAVVALVTSAITWFPHHPGTVAPAGPSVSDRADAVPSHIYAAPASLEPSTDLRVGRTAVAYRQTWHGETTVVTVSADASATYHRLMLPRYDDLVGLRAQPLSLSPDGTQLAYTAVVGDGAGAEAEIRVLDLLQGGVESVPGRPRALTSISTISWSPNSRWVVWAGLGTTSADGQNASLLGRFQPKGTAVDQIETTAPTTPGISDRGEVAAIANGRLVTWADAVVEHPLRVRPATSPVAVWAGPPLRIFREHLETGARAPHRQGPELDVVSGTKAVYGSVLNYPDRTITGSRWIDATHLVLTSVPLSGDYTDPTISLITVGPSSMTARTIGEAPAIDGLTASIGPSFAVALMKPNLPVVDRPEPTWLSSDGVPGWAIGGGIAVAAVGLTGALAWRRRRRTLG